MKSRPHSTITTSVTTSIYIYKLGVHWSALRGNLVGLRGQTGKQRGANWLGTNLQNDRSPIRLGLKSTKVVLTLDTLGRQRSQSTVEQYALIQTIESALYYVISAYVA